MKSWFVDVISTQKFKLRGQLLSFMRRRLSFEGFFKMLKPLKMKFMVVVSMVYIPGLTEELLGFYMDNNNFLKIQIQFCPR